MPLAAERVAATPPGEWVISPSRWHEAQLAEQRFPTRAELDRIAPANPLLIQRGGHNLVVNSLALRLAGIAGDVPNPPDGTYVRDSATGQLDGSDSPVAPYQPLLGIWSSVTRSTALAGVQGPEWAISVDEALRMYALGSAYASFEEDTKGSIAPGKFADLVVRSDDPLRVDPDAIKDLQVLQTLVDGRVVFDAQQGPAAADRRT